MTTLTNPSLPHQQRDADAQVLAMASDLIVRPRDGRLVRHADGTSRLVSVSADAAVVDVRPSQINLVPRDASWVATFRQDILIALGGVATENAYTIVNEPETPWNVAWVTTAGPGRFLSIERDDDRNVWLLEATGDGRIERCEVRVTEPRTLRCEARRLITWMKFVGTDPKAERTEAEQAGWDAANTGDRFE